MAIQWTRRSQSVRRRHRLRGAVRHRARLHGAHDAIHPRAVVLRALPGVPHQLRASAAGRQQHIRHNSGDLRAGRVVAPRPGQAPALLQLGLSVLKVNGRHSVCGRTVRLRKT